MPYRLHCFYLFFFLSASSLFAQISVESEYPSLFVGACAGQYSVKVFISASNDTPIVDGKLSYHLTPGLIYVPASNTAQVSELDISDLNAPVFSLPSPISGPLVFEFLVDATCELSNVSGIVNDELILEHEITEIFSGGNYNIIPIFANLVYNSTSIIKNVGEIACFQVTLRNPESSEQLTQLFVTLDFDEEDLLLDSFSHGELSGTSPVHSIVINEIIPDKDSLVFTHCFELLTCGNHAVSANFSWGCNDISCQSFGSKDLTISTEPSQPFFTNPEKDLVYTTPCKPGSAKLVYKNQGAANNPGSADIMDIQFLVSWETNNEFFLDDCIVLSNFKLGSVPLDMLLVNTPEGVLIDLSLLTTDPDLPGFGIEDLDNDGSFDDISSMESLELLFETLLNPDCLPMTCSDLFPERELKVRINYRDHCDDRQQIMSTGYKYEIGKDNPGEILSTQDLREGLLGLTLFLSPEMQGLQDCENSEVTVFIPLSDPITFNDSLTPTFNGDNIAFSFDGNILELYAPSPSGELFVPLIAFCDTSAVWDTLAPCGGFVSDPPVSIVLDYWLEYYCGEECDDPFLLYCDQTPPFSLFCETATTTVGFVISEMGYSVNRLNYGIPDESCLPMVNPTDPGIAVDIYMPGDTVELRLNAAVLNLDNADDSFIRISYPNFSGLNLLQFESGELTLVDAETGDTIICPINAPTSTGFVNDEYREEFSLLDLVQPGACLDGYHLSDGDQLFFTAFYVASDELEEVPNTINNFQGLVSFLFEDQLFDCGGRTAALTLFKPSFEHDFRTVYSRNGCDTLGLALSYTQLAEVGEDDPFPYEIRPIISWDSIVLLIPNTMTYLENTSNFTYHYRLDNEPSSPILTATVPLNDPVVVDLGDKIQLTYAHLSDLPCVDLINADSSKGELYFEVMPSCIPRQNEAIEADIYFQNRAYLGAGSHQESIIGFKHDIRFRYFHLQLNSPNPIFQGTSDDATYELNVRLNINSATDYVPNARLLFELPNTNFSPTGLCEMENGETTVYPIQALGDGLHFWANIDTLFRSMTRTFILKADFETCEPIDFNVVLDFSCAPYPANPFEPNYLCEHSPSPQTILSFYPDEPSMIAKVGDSYGVDPVELCQNIPVEMRVANNGEGAGVDPIVNLIINGEGISVAPGTSFIETSAGTIAIDDPVLIGDTLQWNLAEHLHLVSGLGQSPDNVFFINFQMSTDCSFDPSSHLIYWVDYADVCAKALQTPPFTTPQLKLIGAPISLNEFEIMTFASPFQRCANDINTLEFAIDPLHAFGL